MTVLQVYIVTSHRISQRPDGHVVLTISGENNDSVLILTRERALEISGELETAYQQQETPE